MKSTTSSLIIDRPTNPFFITFPLKQKRQSNENHPSFLAHKSISINFVLHLSIYFAPCRRVNRFLKPPSKAIEMRQTFSRKMRSSSGDVKAGLSQVTKTCLINGSPFRATCPITDLSVGTVRQ